MGATRRQRGFTLLELIVVIAMMGIVSTIMTAVWFQVTGANRITQVRTELEGNVHDAFMAMRADFDGALSPALASAPLVGTRQLLEEVEQQVGPIKTLKELPSDSVAFETRRSNIDGLMVVERVTYRIERPEGGDAALVRAVEVEAQEETTEDTTEAGEDVEAETEDQESVERFSTVLSGATAMRLEYLSDGDWLEEWAEADNPEAVRVSLLAMVPRAEGTSNEAQVDELQEAVARVAVFPLHTQ